MRPLRAASSSVIGAEVLLGRVDGQPLHRLVDLAVDLAGDHLRLADGQLEALAAHLLDQDRQRQLAAALHLPGVGTLGREDLAARRCRPARVSRRSLTRRAVTLEPLTRPTSGEVLVPMVIEMAGSSTWISGSATGFSGSARVSPMVISGMPATATMSPGPADSPGLRSRPSVTRSSVILTFLTVPSRLHPGDGLALLQGALVDAQQRQAAEERRGVEVGDVRLQRRALGRTSGAGMRLEDRPEQRLEVGGVRARSPFGGLLEGGAAGLGRGVDDREVEARPGCGRLVGRSRPGPEQLVGLVDDLGDPGVGAVGLVDHEDHRHVGVRAPCAARSGSGAAGPRRRRRAARCRRPSTGRARPRHRSRRGRGCR